MSIFKAIKPPILKVLNELFADEALRTEITYQKKAGTIGWDDDLQQNIVQRDTSTLYAILLKHTKKTVEQSNSANVQVGDRLYMIKYSDAPSGMSLNDQIIHDGQTWDIKAIDRIFDFAYSITVEGS